MAPFPARQLLAFSLPSIVVLLSYLWYKKRRIGARSDSGGSKPLEDTALNIGSAVTEIVEKKVEKSPVSSPLKLNRSLSGVETTPIDIVYPPELKSSKSSPVVISDEDLDFEIEKIKSMKNRYQTPNNKKNITKSYSTPEVKNSTPIKNNNMQKKVKEVRKKETPVKKSQQKDMAVVEEKLTNLKMNNNNKTEKVCDKENKVEKIENDTQNKVNDNIKEHKDLHRQNSERDSANHSPSDVMLASPSLSSISDNHSEGSSDSGKGGSEVATPPSSRTPNTVACNVNEPTLYEFIIPQMLVGKLIGRRGCFVQHIKDKTNAHIVVKEHLDNDKLKVCSIAGTKTEIEKALKMIRDKFPVKKYAELTLEQVTIAPVVPTVSLIPDYLYLKLVEGVNNDTILSCMVTPNHLFMQQPTHPSFPSLNLLTNCMNNCYSSAEVPMLPTPIPENTICAAYSVNQWYRAMVLSSDEESNKAYIKYLDYGGYAFVDSTALRQIRQDFILLPFQAAECFLSNVKPLSEDGTWAEGAYELVASLSKGSIMYTQIADYSEEGIPMVLCYVVSGMKDVVFLNQRLVEEGFAEWVPFDDEPSAPAQPEAAAAVPVEA